MAGAFSRITLRASELVGYRAAVIACSRPEERELCERLLGQIASLETQAVAGRARRRAHVRPAAGRLRRWRSGRWSTCARSRCGSRFRREPATWTERRRSLR